MPRKWINTRIEELDPETDYDEIWKLATAYRANDFTMNLVYALTFPHFFVRELDALPLVDGGRGKILNKAHQRSDDTSWKMQVWWHYGSGHEKTRSNVESINRLHGKYAETYGASFSRNDTYIYTLCYEAAGMHRLFRRIGLAGISDNEKRAAVKYWSRMATLFRNAGTREPLVGFPDSFDGIMAYMDRHEAENVPVHAYGPMGARAIIGQFADRYFPKVLHPFVEAWIVSLYPEHLIKAYEFKKPSAPAVWFYRTATALFFWFGEKVLPDPVDTFTERREAARSQAPKPPVAAASDPGPIAAAGCPHLQRMAGLSPRVAESARADS